MGKTIIKISRVAKIINHLIWIIINDENHEIQNEKKIIKKNLTVLKNQVKNHENQGINSLMNEKNENKSEKINYQILKSKHYKNIKKH